jgi:hypothetical protein
MFDLDLDGRFHIAYQGGECAIRLPLQPYKVQVALEQPARQFHIQARLEEQYDLSRLELAGLVDDLPVVVGTIVVLGSLDGIVDGAEVATESLLDPILELMTRQ